jgi:hypothetical protein
MWYTSSVDSPFLERENRIMPTNSQLRATKIEFAGPYSKDLFDNLWADPQGYDYVGAGGAKSYAVAAARALAALRPHFISLAVFRQIEELVQKALPQNAGRDESPDDDRLKVYCTVCVNLER